MGENNDLLKTATRYAGFISSILVAILGVVHVAQRKAYLDWPSGAWNDDVNYLPWRGRLFSLHPDALADHWTPCIFGFVGALLHFRTFHVRVITKSFIRFFIFHFLMALFGSIGYEGGLGILISIAPFVASLLSLITFFVCDDTADLNLYWRFWKGEALETV